MASFRTLSVWVAVVCLPAACTVVANNRLADKPLMGDTGGGGAGTGGGDGGTPSTGGEHEGGTVEAPLQAIGTPCGTDNSVCASGSCVDGVCCDQACIGECFSCNEFGLFGTCTIITGKPGDCMGGQICDAAGDCITVEQGACSQPSECISGFCSDGVCCNEACTGSCESCAMDETGFPNGVCAALEDDDDECDGEGCFAKGQCCGDAAPATGSACPAPCTSCNGSTCTVLCDAVDSCKGLNIVCPQGYDCDIQCTHKHACRDAVIDCPAGHKCDLLCDAPQGDEHACEDGTLTCTDGPCAVVCTGDRPCKGLDINCGSNACGVDCVDAGDNELPPEPVCGTSCDCTDTCN